MENRPGAGTNIANEYVAKSAPDGYTLLFNSSAVVINMSLYRNPPSATPREIVRALAASVAKAAHSPDTRKRLHEQGAEPVGNTPEEFDRRLREEVARWAEVVKLSGARAD